MKKVAKNSKLVKKVTHSTIAQKLGNVFVNPHNLKSKNKQDEIARLEKELDNLVHQLFGIKVA